jgi:hypothetical protein
MPSPSESEVTTVVIEMEPGWVYVKIIDPKPAPDRIELFLRRTIDDWFKAHSQFVIDQSETLSDHGEMHGIHVWYHVNFHQPEPTKPLPQQPPTSMTIEVHGLVIRQVSKEDIEAVVGEVMQIWREHPNRGDTLVAINPRRIAVVLDKQANRGAVLPVQFIEQVLDGLMRTKLQSWLGSPQSRFYVMHLPGSWFESREIESSRIKPVEPTFIRTNMTYDP